jgi:hypothetical protein
MGAGVKGCDTYAFIATPLTCGRRPNHLSLPALPNIRPFQSPLLTLPIVAQQSARMRRISPD